jgi:hypothetical protein
LERNSRIKRFYSKLSNIWFACFPKTEVKILYDNTAIYVGAYLYDDPALIRKQITARDGESQSDVDYFSIFLDTYNDHQNGFQFLVTTANVQTDARLSPNSTSDFNSFGDKTWDAVWESKVSMKADGWVVEMRIPYSSLRLQKKMFKTGACNYCVFSEEIMKAVIGILLTPKKMGL